jgi:hypothetical protein
MASRWSPDVWVSEVVLLARRRSCAIRLGRYATQVPMSQQNDVSFQLGVFDGCDTEVNLEVLDPACKRVRETVIEDRVFFTLPILWRPHLLGLFSSHWIRKPANSSQTSELLPSLCSLVWFDCAPLGKHRFQHVMFNAEPQALRSFCYRSRSGVACSATATAPSNLRRIRACANDAFS